MEITMETEVVEEVGRVTVQLRNEEGVTLGAPFDLPTTLTQAQLQKLCNGLLNLDEPVPCAFYCGDVEIKDSIEDVLDSKETVITESVLQITYQPQAVFRVGAVTRCTSSLPGHGEAIVSARFSPEGRTLASGSGDTTVRLWDLTTELPLHTCLGHTNWVLAVSWSPDGTRLASACKNGDIRVWNPDTGKQIGKTMTAHKKWISQLAWEPLHINGNCDQLASCSKDGDIRIWNVTTGNTVRTLAGHQAGVTCIKWGGLGLIYSASQDRTIKVWRATDGALCKTLQGHGHWVNTMALNTDYVIRTGAFEPSQNESQPCGLSPKQKQEIALARYNKMGSEELLVSGSDDFTLFLWNPSKEKKSIARMTGHQQLINQVEFSPDGRIIASASFDKSIKLWNGKDGKYMTSLRGHVQAVYQICWSSDSRLLVSGSADSTLKVWNVKAGGICMDLPGHADEVYAVDWSPDGQRVVSGGKDKMLKLWRR